MPNHMHATSLRFTVLARLLGGGHERVKQSPLHLQSQSISPSGPTAPIRSSPLSSSVEHTRQAIVMQCHQFRRRVQPSERMVYTRQQSQKKSRKREEGRRRKKIEIEMEKNEKVNPFEAPSSKRLYRKRTTLTL